MTARHDPTFRLFDPMRVLIPGGRIAGIEAHATSEIPQGSRRNRREELEDG